MRGGDLDAEKDRSAGRQKEKEESRAEKESQHKEETVNAGPRGQR